jgi:hypothetical protein
MAIPNKGLNQIRTLFGRVDQLSLPYRSYMQITCLEMERARRNSERKSASQRVALIDARIGEIDRAKTELLQAVAADCQRTPATRLPGLEVRPTAPRPSMGGFKIRTEQLGY